MKTFLLAVISLLSFCFADTHPGLKKAIDSGDIKTAEKLIKKIGVKDVYCPEGLSFENALILYEKDFNDNPQKMWDVCSNQFIEDAKSDICKKSIPLCKHLLSKTEDVYQWIPYLTDIADSKLYMQQYEMRTMSKTSYQKTTKKECLESLNSEMIAADIYLEFLKSQYCDDGDAISTVMCANVYAPAADSVKKYYSDRKEKCGTKPVKAVKNMVSEKKMVNPFALETEIYGAWITSVIKKSGTVDQILLSLYHKLRQNRNADSSAIKKFVREILDEKFFWKDKNESKEKEKMNTWKKNVVIGCMAFDKIDSLLVLPFYVGGGFISCEKAYLNFDESKISWISQKKERVMKSLQTTYATKGSIPDSLATLACVLYKDIDKEMLKLTEINILDCSVLNNFQKSTESQHSQEVELSVPNYEKRNLEMNRNTGFRRGR